ncbi:C-type lectin domain family 4 member E [Mytilus galloprovincialis]|uniref:C-type lectin domain family 4 member E n=1 Tax=Mytilus galloprovincialis TaxID=29158 RepID=A0A8B6F8W7_MYTGA|nr:C-type lectin domain family 4 member E [Mytilus galloprovincialis]
MEVVFVMVNFLTLYCFVFGLAFVASAECQLGWIHYLNKCYYFSADTRNWGAASASCRAHTAELVVIQSESKNRFLAAEISKLKGNFWLDGTDEFAEGNWEWASIAQLFDYSNWHPGEPNNSQGGEDCLMTNDAYNGNWNDALCNQTYKYICERR